MLWLKRRSDPEPAQPPGLLRCLATTRRTGWLSFFCNRIIFGECDEALQSFGLGRQPSDADPVPDAHPRRRRLLLLSEARPRRRSVLYGEGGQRLRALAGRDRAGNAGAGRRPDREEDPGAALLREG